MKKQIDRLVQEWGKELDKLYHRNNGPYEVGLQEHDARQDNINQLERHIEQLQKLGASVE